MTSAGASTFNLACPKSVSFFAKAPRQNRLPELSSFAERKATLVLAQRLGWMTHISVVDRQRKHKLRDEL
jgi:hypothetical protein